MYVNLLFLFTSSNICITNFETGLNIISEVFGHKYNIIIVDAVPNGTGFCK